MNFNKICVYDFETDGKNPNTCNPTELAAVMIDPRSLNIIPNSEFNTVIMPPDIDDINYVELHKDTIDFHAKNHQCEPEKIVAAWKKGVPQKTAWSSFKEYLSKYHSGSDKKTQFTAPIQAGMNILRFDDIIINRLSKECGDLNKDNVSKLFYPRDKIDLMHILFLWFENSNDLESFSMDVIRPYFGLKTTGSHEALKDVKDTAVLISRFMKLHRRFSINVKFRGALVNL